MKRDLHLIKKILLKIEEEYENTTLTQFLPVRSWQYWRRLKHTIIKEDAYKVFNIFFA